MSLLNLIDELSKLSEAEFLVLQQVLSTIKSNVKNANDNSQLAVLWSQYSLKRQKNPNPTNLIDPTTNLPIVEPDVQIVDNYPIIFGNADDVNTPVRSITFAFGAKAFLGYENDAQGTPYLDTNYIGNTPINLAELEVVNYRTLMNAIKIHGSNISETYIVKTEDETPSGSKHKFGTVFFRGGDEKVYYGTTTPDDSKEIVVRDDLNHLQNTITNSVNNQLNTFQATFQQTINDQLDLKLDKAGGSINGTLKVSTNDTSDTCVVRNIDLHNYVNITLTSYIKSDTFKTPVNSSHEFGSVFLRGNTEKSYYGIEETDTPDPQYEIVNIAALTSGLNTKVDKTGDQEIDGTLKVTTASNDPHGIVRNTDLTAFFASKVKREIFTPGTHTWNSGNNSIIELILAGGGAGGNATNAGGGAGVIKLKIYVKLNTDYSIVVGNGGIANTDGQDTSFSGSIGFLDTDNNAILITTKGGKADGNGGGISGISSISGALPDTNSSFSLDIGDLVGVFDIIYAPGAGGAKTTSSGNIGKYIGGSLLGGGASALGNGSKENCTISDPAKDQAGIGGGAGKNATTTGGNGIAIITTFV